MTKVVIINIDAIAFTLIPGFGKRIFEIVAKDNIIIRARM